MYLALLDKEEKELFLGLAFDLAAADGNYSDEEKAMMDAYCQEMQITFDKEAMVQTEDDIIASFKNKSDNKAKKILIFELIGLALADGNYDASEKALVSKLEKEFEMEDGFADKCENILMEYLAFQGKINQLILG
jgi:tellurite resistance protein